MSDVGPPTEPFTPPPAQQQPYRPAEPAPTVLLETATEAARRPSPVPGIVLDVVLGLAVVGAAVFLLVVR